MIYKYIFKQENMPMVNTEIVQKMLEIVRSKGVRPPSLDTSTPRPETSRKKDEMFGDDEADRLAKLTETVHGIQRFIDQEHLTGEDEKVDLRAALPGDIIKINFQSTNTTPLVIMVKASESTESGVEYWATGGPEEWKISTKVVIHGSTFSPNSGGHGMIFSEKVMPEMFLEVVFDDPEKFEERKRRFREIYQQQWGVKIWELWFDNDFFKKIRPDLNLADDQEGQMKWIEEIVLHGRRNMKSEMTKSVKLIRFHQPN